MNVGAFGGKMHGAVEMQPNLMTDEAVEWMRAWRSAGKALERVRRAELRAIDGRKALALLTGPADYRQEPRRARPSSGLVEQQRWFMKARGDA